MRAPATELDREAYNADLRVIRSSGQGDPAVYRVAELTAELEQFLAANLGLAVEMSGDQADPVERALIDGLTKEGFVVVERGAGSSAVPVELLIKGTVRLWPIDAHDPQFRYVRWCTDAVVEDRLEGREGRPCDGARSSGESGANHAAGIFFRSRTVRGRPCLWRQGPADFGFRAIRLSAGGGCAAIESLGSESITERRGDA